jgi:hypothetical protein
MYDHDIKTIVKEGKEVLQLNLYDKERTLQGYTIINKEAWDRYEKMIMKYTWSLGKGGVNVTITFGMNKPKLYLHRCILGLQDFLTGKNYGKFAIKHINGDITDNRYENLKGGRKIPKTNNIITY